jgi:hypothetical protein
MGKRKGRKKRKLKYSKTQFSEIICSGCNLCELLDPDFCYSKYKADPKEFMNHTYGKLRNPAVTILPVKSILAEAFCGKCGSLVPSDSKIISCKSHNKCYDAFNMQLQGIQSAYNLQFERKSKKKKKKNKKKYVCVSYPTFFASESWASEIRSIVDGDKNSEQDRSEESSRNNKVGANKKAQNK